ncbi:hypothetical protein Tco_1030389 [Tanacetum coccineum]|uniref:Transmembrane protein n=1 Tax=Tanacetum coccineum TaxID=301880 RepID=A0ABQ5G7A1_9ASTR
MFLLCPAYSLKLFPTIGSNHAASVFLDPIHTRLEQSCQFLWFDEKSSCFVVVVHVVLLNDGLWFEFVVYGIVVVVCMVDFSGGGWMGFYRSSYEIQKTDKWKEREDAGWEREVLQGDSH